MSAGTGALAERIAAQLAAPVTPEVTAFAAALGTAAGARAVLFYGSNLRTGSLEGVLDFYVLLPGTEEPAIWPTVSYHERAHGDLTLRAGRTTTAQAKAFETLGPLYLLPYQPTPLDAAAAFGRSALRAGAGVEAAFMAIPQAPVAAASNRSMSLMAANGSSTPPTP